MMVAMVAVPRNRASRSRAGRTLRLLGPGLLVLVLAACTDEPSTPAPEAESVAFELSLGPGASGLSPADRDQLQTAVGDTLSAYVVDAFLGDYPRDDFVAALDSFTSGGARLAAEQLDVVTGAGFGSPEDVVATRLDARLSTFAPDEEASGVSAAVNFEFEVADDGSTELVQVAGRLMLTPEGDEWKIFGFDLDDPMAETS